MVAAPRADILEPLLSTVADSSRRPRQYGLDLLRILAICGVVAIHVIGVIVSNTQLKGTTQWWVATAIDLGAVWTVPVFVMISGALVLNPLPHHKITLLRRKGPKT